MSIKKLNNAGMAHLVILLAVVVVVGAVGSFLLYKSHAQSATVSCYANGRSIQGHREYNCGWYTTTPVYNSSGRQVGSFNRGTNWIICQQNGTTLTKGRYANYWWAWTLSNQNTWGWANAVYASTGSNYGAFAGVPACNGSHGPTPHFAGATRAR